MPFRQSRSHVRCWLGSVFRLAAALLVVGGMFLPAAVQGHSAYHVIKAVNESAGTVMVGTVHSNDHTVKVLKVNGFTEITLDGQKATLHDLRRGMMVEYSEDADDVAASISARHHN